MKLLEEGTIDFDIQIKGEKEVVYFSQTFNLLLVRIKNLMNQIVLEQEDKRKSELNALQSQINPHFLYNTLDSIVWMAENGKSEEVITMVTALAKLFRISISRGRNIISAKEELEHAKNYLIIQKTRYKNKFEFQLNYSEEVLGCKTVKLILQPIIENAIYHGIEYKVDKGIIKINAFKEDNNLIFEIIDNGLGMDIKTVKNLLTLNPSGHSGVGVRNVYQRITLHHGKKYGLKINSELEEGTTVTISQPFI